MKKITDNNNAFKLWLKKSEVKKIDGTKYYVLEAELLTKQEMLNQWVLLKTPITKTN